MDDYTGWMIIQGGRLYRVDDYAGWKIIHGGRLYRVEDYTGWMIIQCGRLYRVDDYTGWKIFGPRDILCVPRFFLIRVAIGCGLYESTCLISFLFCKLMQCGFMLVNMPHVGALCRGVHLAPN